MVGILFFGGIATHFVLKVGIVGPMRCPGAPFCLPGSVCGACGHGDHSFSGCMFYVPTNILEKNDILLRLFNIHIRVCEKEKEGSERDRDRRKGNIARVLPGLCLRTGADAG